MKRIEAVVLPSKEKEIVDALQKTGIGGLTVTLGKGRGKGPRNVKPGLGRYIERYNDVLTFFIVVEDSKVDEVVSIITDAAHTGSLGDGKIFISSIDDVVDIATKQKGEKYI
ncbi:MAG: P-II family nitrogen regulator [Nitrosopumilus sp.]